MVGFGSMVIVAPECICLGYLIPVVCWGSRSGWVGARSGLEVMMGGLKGINKALFLLFYFSSTSKSLPHQFIQEAESAHLTLRITSLV